MCSMSRGYPGHEVNDSSPLVSTHIVPCDDVSVCGRESQVEFRQVASLNPLTLQVNPHFTPSQSHGFRTAEMSSEGHGLIMHRPGDGFPDSLSLLSYLILTRHT
jgi:hypothetical protein